jgi:release factor glutamine methyltransferase
MATTVGGALRAATRRLAAGEGPAALSAGSDAEELLSRLLGVGRGDVRVRAGDALPPGLEARLDQQLQRRLAGEPVQYITGRAAFRSLDLVVDRRVLVPRPETEWLVEAVLEYISTHERPDRPCRVLDLGTGSGCIALAIAHEHPRAEVVATDHTEGALEVARANAASLGLSHRVTFLRGDWLDAVADDERFDVIVANPPYIAAHEAGALPRDVREWEPHAALFGGRDGLADLRDIVDQAPRHLRSGGLLALELDESRAAEVAGWFEGARDWRGVEVRPDLAGRPRILLASREHGPAIAPAQWGEEG